MIAPAWRRHALAALACTVAWSVDGPVVIPAISAAFSQIPILDPGEGWLTGSADQPAQIRYEQILLSGHDLRADRQPWGERGPLIPVRGSVIGGHGRAAVLDALATTLPDIGARIRLTPLAVRLRLVTPHGAGALAHYRLVLDEVGSFSGDVRDAPDAWHGYAGWARSAEIDLGVPVLDGRLGTPAIRRITFRGDAQPIGPQAWWPPYPDLATWAVAAAPPAGHRRLTEITRFVRTIGGLMGADLASEERMGSASAEWLTMDFPAGRASATLVAGGMFTVAGDVFPAGP
jgi:hypothetical protein